MDERTFPPRECPEILIISLSDPETTRSTYSNLFTALRAKANLIEVTTVFRAFSQLNDLDQAVSRFNAIIVTDAAVIDSKILTRKLVDYARKRGTVVFGCDFAFEATASEIQGFFAKPWGLEEWEVRALTTVKILFNEDGHENWWHHAERWLDRTKRRYREYRVGDQWIYPLWEEVEGLHIGNVEQKSKVYLSMGPISLTEMELSCVVFQNIGDGWLGFVGAKDCRPEVYVIMCDLHCKEEADRLQEEQWELVREEKEAEKAYFLKWAHERADERWRQEEERRKAEEEMRQWQKEEWEEELLRQKLEAMSCDTDTDEDDSDTETDTDGEGSEAGEDVEGSGNDTSGEEGATDIATNVEDSEAETMIDSSEVATEQESRSDDMDETELENNSDDMEGVKEEEEEEEYVESMAAPSYMEPPVLTEDEILAQAAYYDLIGS